MFKPLPPVDEVARLQNLRDYAILDTPAEAAFNDLAKLASVICNTPIAMVSLVDTDRQWFKAKVGITETQTPRDESFCQHTILGEDLLVIPDATADPRFADNPMVVGPTHVRFYAGAPLVTPEGHALGALCVKDSVPRTLSPAQSDALKALGRQVVSQMRLRRLATQVIAAERFTRATLDTLSARIAVLDQQGKIIAANKLWESAAGTLSALDSDYLSECESIAAGRSVPSRPNWPQARDAAQLVMGIRQVLAGTTQQFALEYAHEGTGGKRVWSAVRVKPLEDDGPRRVVVTHQDVTDRHVAAEQLWHDSRHDPLTGLPNRLHFAERVDHCISLARRGRCNFAVLFLDLDRFKIINDSLGHAAGDKLLKTIADRISGCLRPTDVVATTAAVSEQTATYGSDTVARMGGDEFTILLEHLSAPEDAARVAERILSTVARPVEFESHELIATASIGIVACSCGSPSGMSKYDNANDVLRDADSAMYKAKGAGKDRYAVFDQAMHTEVVARMRLEGDLRRAVERDELTLHYQPIVDVASTEVVGLEALVRWRRDGSMQSPADFIPVAEDTGIIIPIGTWVLREACRQLAAWRSCGAARQALYVTVNLSRKQLADPALLSVVQRALASSNLPASALGLEITESAIMEDPVAAEAALIELKSKLGVRLAVDDFGTGYSSLSCLRRFPIDLLKIDRSFVQNVVRDRRDAAVMSAIVVLAHNLNLSVVAEGIETHDQAAFMSSSQCDLMQGFLFSRPLDAAAAERFLNPAPATPAAA
jgi:predicted signal transduction protein with EAL and GGDEF domain/GAF domain-containing protein